jgi:hypothetical protein
LNQIENRLTQIIGEIDRLQASIDYNYEKFAFVIQRAFAEGKRIEVSGQGIFNGMIWTWERAYVHTGLLFQDENMVFVDDVKNVYSIKIGNITSIVVKENEDVIPSQGCEAVSSINEACQ